MNTNIYNVSKKFIKFIFVWLITYICNTLIVYIVTDIYHFAFYVSILIVFIFNITIVYLLQNRFTFGIHHTTVEMYLTFVLRTAILITAWYFLADYIKKSTNISYYRLVSMIAWAMISILNFICQSFIFTRKKWV